MLFCMASNGDKIMNAKLRPAHKSYYEQEPRKHKKDNGRSICGKIGLSIRYAKTDDEVDCKACRKHIENGGSQEMKKRKENYTGRYWKSEEARKKSQEMS